MNLRLLTFCLAVSATSLVFAHDTWVETNTNLIRSGDAVYVDLKLGNHGNDHRDFKIASKIDLESSTVHVIDPEGKSFDLKGEMADTGYAPKEGYWTGKFSAFKPGVYTVSHTLEKIVNHGKATRAIKSGKTYFQISQSLDKPVPDDRRFAQPLGHALEIVPIVNPVLPMAAGRKIKAKVLFKGQPLSDGLVSFIPRGTTLKEGFDEQYEQKTDANGEVTFTPKFGQHYLMVIHHAAPGESGEGYESTAYSATMTIFVPDLCMCCE